MSALMGNRVLCCTLACLLAGGAAADEAPSSGIIQAVVEYENAIAEIERIAAQGRLQARQRLEQALKSLPTDDPKSQDRFQGMLGSYFNQDGRLPFTLLSVPNGENVLGDYARQVMNGKYDFSKPLTKFHARGHVVIPQEGTYYLEGNRGYGDFKLNGLGYNLRERAPLNRYRALVTLKPGVYDVEFSVNNNGGQLPEASIRVLAAETEQVLPIFVYESELKAFQRELVNGSELIEVSKWTAQENRLE